MLGSLASPAQLLSQQIGLPQAVLAAQAPGLITGLTLDSPVETQLDIVASFVSIPPSDAPVQPALPFHSLSGVTPVRPTLPVVPQVGLVNPVLASPPITSSATSAGTPTSATQQQPEVKREVQEKQQEKDEARVDAAEQRSVNEHEQTRSSEASPTVLHPGVSTELLPP